MNLFHLKPALVPLVFFWLTAPLPPISFSHFRYQRAVTVSAAPASAKGTACAILDSEVFAHAAPALKDLRLYSGLNEIPYTTTVSEPPQQDTDDARILNLHVHAGRVIFDLEMPRRPYTGVVLDLASRDFIATATVSGSATPGGRNSTPLGTFTLFDLTSQHLSRSTAIPLLESTFPYLHLELAFVPARGGGASSAPVDPAAAVKAAAVPPSREAQSLYTTTQPPQPLIQTGHDSVALFNVSARVPIERIAFTVPPGYKGDFSRAVRIEARGTTGPDTGDNSGLGDEDGTGTILRVHKSEAGHDLSAEILTIPVAIGSNMQQPAVVEVHVEATTGASLPLSVELQMRQRRICFDAGSATAPLTLYYGDPSLGAPAYATAPLSSATLQMTQLASETLNPAFIATPSPRRLTTQRPILRWIALLGCVGIFALLVIRATHKRQHSSR